MTIIKKSLEENEKILSHTVFCKEINKNGIAVTIEYFTAPISLQEFDEIKQTVNFNIKKILEEKDIELAGEANTIIINNDIKEN